MENKNTWELYDEKQLKELEVLSKEYRDFLDSGKTERECVDTIVNMIEKEGYKELETLLKEGKKLKKGDKVYAVCMNKTVAMFQIGNRPFADGMNILGADRKSTRLNSSHS